MHRHVAYWGLASSGALWHAFAILLVSFYVTQQASFLATLPIWLIAVPLALASWVGWLCLLFVAFSDRTNETDISLAMLVIAPFYGIMVPYCIVAMALMVVWISLTVHQSEVRYERHV